MSHERTTRLEPQKPYEVFDLTEKEALFWRVTDERFKEIMQHPDTAIHSIEISSNNYGEFLFITLSRRGLRQPIFITFYGLGFHDYRERWITQEWFWYQTQGSSGLLCQRLTKEESEELLAKHMAHIRPYVRPDTQTDRGQLFEMLADLTDEDGALAELEDLGDIYGILG